MRNTEEGKIGWILLWLLGIPIPRLTGAVSPAGVQLRYQMAWIIMLDHVSHRWQLRFAARLPGLPDSRGRKDTQMLPYHPYLGPVAALVAGILILIQPGLLSLIVAIYLIVTGILGLLGARRTGRWW